MFSRGRAFCCLQFCEIHRAAVRASNLFHRLGTIYHEALVRTNTHVTDIDEYFKHVDIRMEFYSHAMPTARR
jgi:hypothetical protein